jgi:O-methyltransferase
MSSISKSIFTTFSNILSGKNLFLIKSLVYLKRPRRINTKRLDFIRMSTLELVAEEIYQNKIPGNVAELGVYKGEFAKEINSLFPDRKLFLFDTFEGFDKKDIDAELKNSFSSGKQDFSDTSVESVLAKMKYKENCIVKKGFFPESAAGVDEKFSFVSIDADLYQPIYSGLHFFYPKLNSGGYIFVHDFNNEEYKGAREAVIKFCSENNCSYVPIGDIGGTAIISKHL